jgi:hypothetical protein
VWAEPCPIDRKGTHFTVYYLHRRLKGIKEPNLYYLYIACDVGMEIEFENVDR